MNITWSPGSVIWIALAIYIIGIAIFIVLDNRRPQSTFAWLMLMVTLPVVGLIVYLFLGRNWHAFSKENELARRDIGSDFLRVVQPLRARHAAIVARIARERPATYNYKLLQLIANNSGSILTEYNEVTVLQDASEKYPRLLEDLRQAKHSIHLEYYIWTNDEFTQELKAGLIERAKAGVEVRALYDASSAKLMGKEYQEELRAGGVDIRPYLEYSRLRTLHNAQYRCHRKIVVIDGKIGYLGGMNLDKEQLEGPKGFSAWRDTHLRIHGEAAAGIQGSFVLSWYNTTKQSLADACYFPLTEIRREVTKFTPVQIAQSGPDSQWAGLRQLYFFLILAAKEKVQIQSPFFIPDETVSEALRASALAGVDVQLISQPRGGSYQVPYRAAYTYYAELARAGMRTFLYQNNTYFHSKTINVDSAICSIGSANMDIRSYSIDYEINAVLYDEALAHELAADFEHDLASCSEFSLGDYEKSSLFRRLLDSIYRLFSPLL